MTVYLSEFLPPLPAPPCRPPPCRPSSNPPPQIPPCRDPPCRPPPASPPLPAPPPLLFFLKSPPSNLPPPPFPQGAVGTYCLFYATKDVSGIHKMLRFIHEVWGVIHT